MKKFKPKPKIKILAAYWYNPIWWLALILAPFVAFIIAGSKEFYEVSKDLINDFKSWDIT